MTSREEIKALLDTDQIYIADTPEMKQVQDAQQDLVFDFNACRPSQMEKKQDLCKKMFGSFGQGSWIEGPIRANWACNTYWGSKCYANFNLVLVDDGRIDIGDHTMFGPNVTIVTTGHTIRPDIRAYGTPQFTVPVSIGRNVWIGAGAIVMPGVTIGDNTVVGAGSLVTKDIPSDVVAYGHPCKVIRPINDHDYEYFWRDRRYQTPYDARPFKMEEEG